MSRFFETEPISLARCASWALPLLGEVHAGFPSPAADFIQERLDLFKLLVQHPQATFFLRIRGDSMRDCGIFDGDIVVVDRAFTAKHSDIVVAVVDGEFTCKQFYRRNGITKLKAANPTYPDIVPKDGQVIEVWGVVTATIKRFRTA